MTARSQVYDWPTYEDPDSDVIVGDALTRIDGTVDLEGGWFDAGDFIKFTHTTAYAVGLMYAAQRDLGDSAASVPAARGALRPATGCSRHGTPSGASSTSRSASDPATRTARSSAITTCGACRRRTMG